MHHLSPWDGDSLGPGFEAFIHAVFGLLLVPSFLGITHRFTLRET